MSAHRKCTCPFCTKQRRRRRTLNAIALLFCLMLLASVVMLFTGCTSTVTPKIIEPKQASFSGNALNSGVISFGPSGWVVDGNWRARYNALIEIYGAQRNLKRDAGMTKIQDGDTPDQERWLIDRQHFDQGLLMSLLRASGIQPTQ